MLVAYLLRSNGKKKRSDDDEEEEVRKLSRTPLGIAVLVAVVVFSVLAWFGAIVLARRNHPLWGFEGVVAVIVAIFMPDLYLMWFAVQLAWDAMFGEDKDVAFPTATVPIEDGAEIEKKIEKGTAPRTAVAKTLSKKK